MSRHKVIELIQNNETTAATSMLANDCALSESAASAIVRAYIGGDKTTLNRAYIGIGSAASCSSEINHQSDVDKYSQNNSERGTNLERKLICPCCHSSNVKTSRVLVHRGDKVKAALGITAAVGAAALTATAAPVVAPVVAVLGMSGVHHLIHHGAETAAEAGKDKYRDCYVCNDCGHEW